MAVKRTPQSDCLEHTLEINNLKKDMEMILRHHNKFSKAVDDFEIMKGDFRVSIIKLENSLSKIIDIPDKVRKLEDKSLFVDVLNKLAWIGIGAFIAVLVNQNFVATREKHEYSVEKSK